MPRKKSKSPQQDSELHESLVNYAVKGKVTKVKQCIREGVNLNKVLPETPGYNVLFMVIMVDPFTQDHLKVMQILIANGADVSNRAWIKEANQYTSLLNLACSRQNISALDLLIKSGAEINFQNSMPLLHIAVHQNSLKMTEGLLKHKLIRNKIDYKSKDCDDATALHYALKCGYNDIALLLIENGANVNAKDEAELFVIHAAAAKGTLTYQIDVDHQISAWSSTNFSHFWPIFAAK